jgi:tRNA (cmo5U34)-methyltransferase
MKFSETKLKKQAILNLENVAKVFDDMLNRSVPFYGEVQRMMAELAANHAVEGSFVYDLGCSTGTTMIGMDTLVPKEIKFIGIDDSQEMLDKCKSKLMEMGFSRPYELRCADLGKGAKLRTLQWLCFVLHYSLCAHLPGTIIEKYFGRLNPGGVLILVEKVLAEESNLIATLLITIIIINAAINTANWKYLKKERL